MLHIITCNYHDCEQQHFYTQKLPANQVVNIAMIVTFVREGHDQIKFSFNGHDPIIWTFINDGIRNKEYDRIWDWVNNIGIGDKVLLASANANDDSPKVPFEEFEINDKTAKLFARRQ